MTKASKIVEKLLARRPVHEGLEGHLTRYLETLGYQQGQDFYFENGLKIQNQELVNDIIDAINNSGQFGPASLGAEGQVNIGRVSSYSDDPDEPVVEPEPVGLSTGPEEDVDPSTLAMCDVCGSPSHHTEDCPYGRPGGL